MKKQFFLLKLTETDISLIYQIFNPNDHLPSKNSNHVFLVGMPFFNFIFDFQTSELHEFLPAVQNLNETIFILTAEIRYLVFRILYI